MTDHLHTAAEAALAPLTAALAETQREIGTLSAAIAAGDMQAAHDAITRIEALLKLLGEPRLGVPQ